MKPLPKIVTQRLQAGLPGPHPDANLLAAFAEESLTRGERDQVFAHLARCADCRDIVSFATPEAALVPIAEPRRFPLLSWPVLRWGAAAACLVVVGAAVLFRHDFSSRETVDTAQFVASESRSTDRSANPVAEPNSGPADAEKAKPASSIKKKNDAHYSVPGPSSLRSQTAATPTYSAGSMNPPVAAPPPPVVEGRAKQASPPANLPLEGRNEGSVSESGAMTTAPASVARDERSGSHGTRAGLDTAAQANEQTKEEARADASVANQQPAVSAANRVAPLGALVGSQKSQAPAAFGQVASSTSGLGKVKIEAKDDHDKNAPQQNARSAAGAAALVSSEAIPENAWEADKLAEKKSYLSPRWTLAADGTLQRSLDGGKTWEAIAVPSGGAALRAISSLGLDIWVGGAAGTLYHSSDGGQHWVQVKPVSGGQSLTSDIQRIEFLNSRQGRLSTSGPEVWTTSDGGQSWEKK